MLLAGGAGQPRDLPVPGRELQGIHFAMEYLTLQNRRCEGDDDSRRRLHHARRASDVIIIGGGDTGADCLGTAHRQGARSVHQLELMPMPPQTRAPRQSVAAMAADLPRVDGARGGRRAPLRRARRERFVGDASGRVRALHGVKVEMVAEGRPRRSFVPVPGASFEIKADLVLLAMGFVGPERGRCSSDLGVHADATAATSRATPAG